jgi:hypothetical protein
MYPPYSEYFYIVNLEDFTPGIPQTFSNCPHGYYLPRVQGYNQESWDPCALTSHQTWGDANVDFWSLVLRENGK